MADAVILFLSTVIALEIAKALRLMRNFARLGSIGQRANRLLLRRGVSEWAKERAMRLTAIKLFAQSLRTAFLLALVGVPICASFLIASAPADWPSRISLLAATLIYSAARRRLRLDRDSADRLLHRVTLGAAPVRDICFDIERAVHARRLPHDPGADPVFVAGLARAGTTILMRLLHESGEFSSLSYRDLPFPLAPNCWARVASGSKRTVATTERGHGDGILHDLDSPEAIEEVFWGHFEGERFRLPNGLSPEPVAPATIKAFRDYVRLVQLSHGCGRYLSKNNNNILRLPALIEAFPDARLLHPFRDPLQQAVSLRHQHLRACALAEEDPFRRDFMSWLGHHEFGADHRPFLLDNEAALRLAAGDSATLDYWLAQWIAVHRFLLDQPDAVARQQSFIDYDRLCAEGDRLAPSLAARLALAEPVALHTLRSPALRPAEAEPALMAAAYEVHAMLSARSDDAFGRRADQSFGALV